MDLSSASVPALDEREGCDAAHQAVDVSDGPPPCPPHPSKQGSSNSELTDTSGCDINDPPPILSAVPSAMASGHARPRQRSMSLPVRPPSLPPAARELSVPLDFLPRTGDEGDEGEEGREIESDDVDQLAHEWARLKLETSGLRELCDAAKAGVYQLTRSNNEIRHVLHDDEEEEERDGASQLTSLRTESAADEANDDSSLAAAMAAAAAEDDEEDEPVVYRGASAPSMQPACAYRSLSAAPPLPGLPNAEPDAPGKRQRGRDSELAPMMLQPRKQSSGSRM